MTRPARLQDTGRWRRHRTAASARLRLGLRRALLCLAPLLPTSPAFATALPLPAAASPPVGELAGIEQAYRRYAATGRGDARLHLSPDGEVASARTTDNGDGTTTCRVVGLRAPPGLEPALARLRLAAVVVHETTHCLLDSHAAEPPSSGADAGSRAAQRLMRLTQESIADARSVIEIARRDGPDAAQRLVTSLLPERLQTDSPSHTTARALRAALAAVQAPGGGPARAAGPGDGAAFAAGSPGDEAAFAAGSPGDGAAFAAALGIGRRSADETLREDLARDGRPSVADAPEVEATRRALDTALLRAQQAWARGAYANDAFTLRARARGHDPADRHVYLAADGTAQHRAVVDAEGAHDAARLGALMAAGDDSLAHHLAVYWLRREGQLDAEQLVRVRAAIARVLPPLRNEADGAWARQVFERTVEEMAGQDPAAVLEEAAQRLRGGPPPG